jgi:hypothetical protein
MGRELGRSQQHQPGCRGSLSQDDLMDPRQMDCLSLMAVKDYSLQSACLFTKVYSQGAISPTASSQTLTNGTHRHPPPAGCAAITRVARSYVLQFEEPSRTASLPLCWESSFSNLPNLGRAAASMLCTANADRQRCCCATPEPVEGIARRFA